ncbi:glycoside hydrolase family 13 protein [Capnocytophaga sp.]|uniref:glycoside hydrolase family 13 protein n=1 Tax=Capnocytophaga sp. TaxID=44737 RepID=UPI0026DC8566|nr:glycoside hydrolase family 13 protein [Capnocytophaga sp.]MDO5106367.1 glycoside hydrolase family 13 protein [Capnocytophaga sp.]
MNLRSFQKPQNHFRKLIVLMGILFSLTINAQIQRTEPPFWWADMHNPELQIMLYGKDIAHYLVESELPVVNVIKTENPNYIFLTVNTKDKQAGVYKITLSDAKKKVTTLNYELKKRREGSALRKGFDSSDVVYLLMPDRFANGDTNNDSKKELTEQANRKLPEGRHGGDIKGIINHLDYIKSLGATAIWSTPMCEDNDATYSYHTYAQSDVYNIDARYGNNETYKQLAQELHKRGMKLIKDYVTNHWGATHWMINDLPTYDWIHQFPGYAQSNYRMSTQMDSNTSERDKKYCVDGWFVKSMPDLNQSNPLVLKYLTQNAIWWIEYADLDGLRVDTYSYNDKESISKWTKAIMAEYPNFNIVGEVWLHDQAQISYWQKDSPISAIQSYNTYLPSVMDFTLHDAIGEAFKTSPSWDKGMIQLYDNFVNDFLYKDINNILIFAENHDTSRINEIYQNTEDYKLIMTLLATVRGIPQLYYGSEIGMRGDKSKGDAHIRQDFPSGWKEDKQNAFNPSERTQQQKEYFDFTAKLFNWRKEKSVIHYGKTKQYLPENEVYIYFRYNPSESVMVIINNNKEEQTIDLNRFEESLQGFTKGKEIISGKEFQLQKTLQIKGKTSMIIELK